MHIFSGWDGKAPRKLWWKWKETIKAENVGLITEIITAIFSINNPTAHFPDMQMQVKKCQQNLYSFKLAHIYKQWAAIIKS